MNESQGNQTATPDGVAVSPIPIAIYDACVLFPDFLRDVLLRIAAADLVECHWTDEIQDEWSRNLLKVRPDADPKEIREKMERAFPHARIVNYERHIARLTNDAKDRHVLAAAIEANARRIITLNVRDFLPKDLAVHGVVAVTPDDFVTQLYNDDAETLVLALGRHRRGLRKPVVSASDYVTRCERNNLINVSRLLAKDSRL